MIKLPNLELLEYKARIYFFSNRKNRELYLQKRRKANLFTAEVFIQTWPSTCLGFDVDQNGNATAGGQAFTDAYTTVFCEPETLTYLVFFGEEICYQVQNPKEEFFEDLKRHRLLPLSQANKIY